MRKFTFTLLVFPLLFLSAPLGSAHGEILSTFPAQYANTTPIPTQVWIQFDGNLAIIDGETINTIDVVDASGLIVSYGDPTIEGGKISTKISGQSVAGVFTVNYRIVSEDGHPVEGSYDFNASPDYAETEIATTAEPPAKKEVSFGPILLGALLLVSLTTLLLKNRREKK